MCYFFIETMPIRSNHKRRLYLNGRVNTLLPLYERAVFIDWNGVLNNELFWSSILENPRHHLHTALKEAVSMVFRDRNRLRDWMRGNVNSEQVVSSLMIELGRRFGKDFLLRRLHEDCSRMVCEPRLVEELHRTRPGNFIVLATDNMDCFWQAALSLKDLGSTFDAILCSSELRVLKKDGVDLFFGPWLYRHHLSFNDSLLLDDSTETCQAFRSAGGTSVVVQNVDDAIRALQNWRTQQPNPNGHQLAIR